MIDTKALRQKILDLAFQGKLTEQLPEDGTGEELFQQIQEEKRRLEDEGKIKKNKPLPQIDETEIPFEIPESWKWTRIKDVCIKIVDGDHNPPPGINEKTEYIMLSAQNIIDDQIGNLEKVRYLSKDVFILENTRTNLEEGDILLTIVGTIGRSCVYTGDNHYCFQRSVAVITTRLFPKYLKYVFDSSYIQQYMSKNATGDAQLGFYLNKLEKLVIPIPSYSEQIRIVNTIESFISYLHKIDELKKKYEDNLSSLKSKLIDAAIQGKLTEQLPEDGTAEELYQQIQQEKRKLVAEGKIKKQKLLSSVSDGEKLFDIPENWIWVRWGNVINIVSARRVHQSDWKKEGIPFYRAREIAKLAEFGFVNNELFISEELFNEFSKTGVPQPGDLMVTGVGTLGRTYVVGKGDRFYYKDASVLCFENYGKIDPYYLAFVMRSDMMKQQIGSNSSGTTVDTLTMVRMVMYLLPLPPLAEQKRIVARLEELLPLCE